MNLDTPLLQTKLRPPFIRAERVDRPRLQARLAEGLRGPLTLVIAPAGFGKSTLLASSLAAGSLPAAWLSLDRGDNQSGRFLAYLAAALRSAAPEVGAQAAQLLSTAQDAPPEVVLTGLINEIEQDGREMVLVLDDYQAITSPAVHAALTFLVENLPAGLHLAVASRSDPPIPAARLRARGQVVELRAADLRFTPEEAARFLNDVMGLRLEPSAVALLEERTEGWIAGLQMAALSMRGREDTTGLIEKFSGTQRFILDYLLEEVLAGQPPEVQQFLLHTSILDRFTASLCAALLAGEYPPSLQPDPTRASTLIDHLERANLFLIPLDDDRRWYRYHHLFADLLRARLHQLEPDRTPQLHRRAAGWLEAEGLTVDAVNHALAAGDHEHAARLVEENTAALLARGELSALMGWIGALPRDLLLTRPWLCVQQACALAFAGRLSELHPLLDHAEQTSAAWSSTSEKRALDGVIAAVRAMAAVMSGADQPAVDLAHRALDLLPADRPWEQSTAYWSMGYAQRSLGRLEAAGAAFEEQARLALQMGNIWALVTARMDLASVLRAQGDLRQARALLEEALSEAARQGARGLGYIARMESGLAALLYEQNDLETARRLLEDALGHLKQWPNPNHLAYACALQARVLLALGDPKTAARFVLEAGRVRMQQPLTRLLRRLVEIELVRVAHARPAADDDLSRTAREWVGGWQTELSGAPFPSDEPGLLTALALARINLADQPASALPLIEQAEAAASAAGQVNLRISALALFALAHSEDDRFSALTALRQALELAEPGRYARVFLDEGQAMRTLLEQARSQLEPGSRLALYAASLLDQIPVQSPPARPAVLDFGLPEPLSRREIEVLALIAEGRTNQQIAVQLYLATGTVKAHTAAIFRKLDAANRVEAVARARRLGILP